MSLFSKKVCDNSNLAKLSFSIDISIDKKSLKESLPKLVEIAKPVVIALATLALFATFFALYTSSLPFMYVILPSWLQNHMASFVLLSGTSALIANPIIDCLFSKVVSPWARSFSQASRSSK